MRFAFFCSFDPGYSGGRIHALLMMEALASHGHEVDVYANRKPDFWHEFAGYPAHRQIRWRGLPAATVAGRCDFVIAVHEDTSPRADALYAIATLAATAKRAPLVLLSFESDGWYSRLVPQGGKPLKAWDSVHATLPMCALVLCSAAEAQRNAALDYGGYNPELQFETCSPCINVVAAAEAKHVAREKRILVFARFETAHKNSGQLADLFDSRMAGYTLAIVCGAARHSRVLGEVEARANACGVEVEVLTRLSEQSKFRELRRARVTAYPTSFEGYGLIPIESRFCGTPCVSFDLPVIREVNGDTIAYVPPGDFQAMRDALTAQCASTIDRGALIDSATEAASFDRYADRLHAIFSSHRNLTPPPLRGALPSMLAAIGQTGRYGARKLAKMALSGLRYQPGDLD